MNAVATQKIVRIEDLPVLQKQLIELEKVVRPVAVKLLQAVNVCHPNLQEHFINCLRMALAMNASIAEQQAKLIEMYNAIIECFPEEGKT